MILPALTYACIYDRCRTVRTAEGDLADTPLFGKKKGKLNKKKGDNSDVSETPPMAKKKKSSKKKDKKASKKSG